MSRFLVATILLISTPVSAMTYECRVSKKVDESRFYSESELNKWMFSISIVDSPTPSLTRCSFSTVKNEITCDTYEVDKVAFDQNINAKKFYHFSSQFDVQLFRDMSFVENNGRGGFAYGKCERK